MQTVADMLAHLRPCREAREWAADYTDPALAWAECERGDWMLWIAGHMSGPPEGDGRRKLVGAAVDCARLVLPSHEARYPDDNRPRVCLDTAERWSRGKATSEEVRRGRAAVASAAYSLDAAYSAYAATRAADLAADLAVADAAGEAAAYVADGVADALARCAEIVRHHYPDPPVVR